MNNLKDSEVAENTFEVNFKEKFIEIDLESSNRSEKDNNIITDSSNHKEKDSNILTELYDSLDKKKVSSKMEFDSLEVNLNTQDSEKLYDSLEVKVWSKNSSVSKNTAFRLENVLKKPCTSYQNDEIVLALENIKILNEIQKKIHKIKNLVDIVKKNVSSGKVRVLCMNR